MTPFPVDGPECPWQESAARSRYKVHLPLADNIRRALGAAERKLSSRRAEALRRRINIALANYVTVQLVDRSRRAVTPSKLLQYLGQVERAAKSADGTKIRALWRDSSLAPAIQELRRVAQSLEVPSTRLETDSEDLRRVANIAASRLHARIRNARARTSPGKARERRHVGNEPMGMLFGTLNTLWATYFRELPGISNFDMPGGPYLSFVHAVLHAFARRISDDIEAAAPGIRAGLRLTPHAIHGHFRRTGFSALRRIGKRFAKECRN
jgi:hypothetical protein